MKENPEQNDHQMWTVAAQGFISSQNNISAFDNANFIIIIFFLLNAIEGLAIFCVFLPQKETCTFEENITGSNGDTLEKNKLRFLHLNFFLNFWRILADSGVWSFHNLFSVLYFFFVGKLNIIFLSFSFLMPYVLSSESVVVNPQVYLA